MIGTCDIGKEHFVFNFRKDNIFNLYLFSFQTVRELYENLQHIFTPDFIKQIDVIYIEQQLPNTPNIIIFGQLAFYFESIGVKYLSQSAKKKYKILSTVINQKSMSVIYVQEKYILSDTIKVMSNQNFGCKKKIVKHKWLADQTYDFMIENNIDKMDDISDTVLMHLCL